MEGEEESISEKILSSKIGAKYVENGFSTGDPRLTGQAFGKYLKVHAIFSQKRRKACASILQLVKPFSTLQSAIEGAAKSQGPKKILRAAELKNFTTVQHFQLVYPSYPR